MNQLKSFFLLLNQLNFTQKIALGTLCIAAIATLMFFFNYSQSDYDVMFSGLDESDAAAIVHNLRKQGVNYKLAEGGTTILVPKNQKEELRLGAFQDDLIKSDKTLGFGVLDSLPFGLTDWQEQKYDQKIISDEVTKTLEAIDGIRKARVMLAKGADSVFTEDKVDTTASVLLITEPGYRIPSSKVRTIKQIVAKAVPGLNPDNVTVADSSGNTLSDDLGTSMQADGTTEGETLQRMVEKQKTKDILEMLTAVVGPNNAVVKVSAKMNFDQTQSHIKRFIPTGGTAENPTGIPVSVQSNQETYDKAQEPTPGEGGQGGGEPGVASNIPEYQGQGTTTQTPADPAAEAPTTDKEREYNNNQLVTNYEISHEERTTVHAPGKIEKLTIAVIVNKVLTQTEVEELNKLVANAAGLDVTRGDTVQVSGLQFAPEALNDQAKAMDILEQSNWFGLITKIFEMSVIFLLSVVALFTFFRLLKQPLQGDVYYEEEREEPVFMHHAQELISAATIPVLEAKLDPELEHMREAITTVISKDPGEAARVLSTFMSE